VTRKPGHITGVMIAALKQAPGGITSVLLLERMREIFAFGAGDSALTHAKKMGVITTKKKVKCAHCGAKSDIITLNQDHA